MDADLSQGSSESNTALEGGADDITTQLEQTREQLGQYESMLQGTRRELEDTKRSTQEYQETFERVRKAFSPGQDNDGPQVDPEEQELNALIDKFVEAGVEADRKGYKMPLTMTAGIKGFEYALKAHKTNQELRGQVQELTRRIDLLANPQAETDRRAWANMDAILERTVEQLYGTNPESFDERAAQFQAYAQIINKEISKLRKDNPGVWAQVARDPQKQAQLVQHFVQRALPPKVRQNLEQQRLRESPLTMQDCLNALQEAREKIKDPAAREKVVSEIRQQMWDIKLQGKKTPPSEQMSRYY